MSSGDVPTDARLTTFITAKLIGFRPLATALTPALTAAAIRCWNRDPLVFL